MNIRRFCCYFLNNDKRVLILALIPNSRFEIRCPEGETERRVWTTFNHSFFNYWLINQVQLGPYNLGWLGRSQLNIRVSLARGPQCSGQKPTFVPFGGFQLKSFEIPTVCSWGVFSSVCSPLPSLSSSSTSSSFSFLQ